MPSPLLPRMQAPLGSMKAAGPGGVTWEAWAKACVLALLDQARAGKRDFVGILFSLPPGG
jgi:uncharacterized protein with von Willebrand factor type A (vWA) domain